MLSKHVIAVISKSCYAIVMQDHISLGEYVRRLRRSKRWELQDVARESGVSLSHLSRIENDHAIPNPETVVKLVAALDGNLDQMLQLANNLPKEILERLVGSTEAANRGRLRTTGGERPDPGFIKALVDEMDPTIRTKLAELATMFGMDDKDVDGIFSVLQKLAQMNADEREAVIGFLASSGNEGSK